MTLPFSRGEGPADTRWDGDGPADDRRYRLEPSDISELRHATTLDCEHALSAAANAAPAELVTGNTLEKGLIQSVDRALDLLELLCTLPGEAKLQDIASLTGLKTSTCHHLLGTLAARRFIARSPKNRTYIPGPRIMELAQHMMNQVDLLNEAIPYLEGLRQRLQESVYFGAMKGTDLTILHWLDGPRDVDDCIRQEAITHAAHATALGKSILAWLPEPQIARVVADKGLRCFTDRTIGSLGTLVEGLRQIRRYGFAVEDQEFREGVVAVATTIRDRNGAVIGAIGCSIPIERADREYIDRLQRTMTNTTNEFSRRFSSLFLHFDAR